MSKIGDLFVKLGLKNGDYDRGIDKSKKKTNSFAQSIKKIGGTIIAAFAAKKIFDFGKSAIEASDIQQKAEQSLLVALNGRRDVQQALIKQAGELQKKTLFGDEETIKAQALIAAFVKEKDSIRQVLPLVQDLATAKNMDLAGAADLVSKTLGSSTNALSRYGIEVKGAVGSQERLTSLTNGLATAFGGQAEAAAKAGAGPMKQLSNAWGDIKETIGKYLIPILNKVAQWFLSKLPAFEAKFTGVRKAIISVINYFIDLYNESTAFRVIVSGIGFTFKEIWATIKLVLTNIVNGIKNLGALMKDVFTGNWKEIKNDVKNFGNDIKNSFSDFGKKSSENYKKSFGNITEKAKIPLLTEGQADDYYKSGEEAGKNFANGIKSGIKKVPRDKVEGMSAMKTIGTSQVTGGEAAVGGLASFDFKGKAEYMQSQYDKLLADERKFTEDFKQIFNSGINEGIAVFADGLGKLMTGDISFKDFGKNILSVIASFMVQFGKLLIAYAIAASGLEAAISNPAAWPVALAAGVALVAIGSAFSSLSNKGLSSGGSGGYAPASGYSNYNSSSGTAALSGNVTFELEGNKLIGAIDNTHRRNRLMK